MLFNVRNWPQVVGYGQLEQRSKGSGRSDHSLSFAPDVMPHSPGRSQVQGMLFFSKKKTSDLIFLPKRSEALVSIINSSDPSTITYPIGSYSPRSGSSRKELIIERSGILLNNTCFQP